ncbi:MAG: tripartite tricarboxylate transporter TctB family protein [Gemmobacter sp.]
MQPNEPRRPGELAFNIALFLASLFLLYSAYSISGFEALSAPGAVPMATTAVMVITAGLTLRQTLRKPALTAEKLSRDIIPMPVIVTIAAVVLYALLLAPLGFLPTSVLFLFGLIWYLSARGPVFSIVVSLVTVAVIYLIFRLIFTVLMPPGIVPEGEMIAWLRGLFSAGN